MSHIYVVPNWFFGLSIGFEVFFALTTVLVAYYALKVYGISRHKNLRMFGIGFILISLSYSLWAIMNAFISRQVFQGIREMDLDLTNLWLMSNLAVYAHAILFVSGLVLIAYATLKIDSRKTLALILALCIIMIIMLCTSKYYIVYVISSILVLFIFMNYVEEYRKSRNKTTGAIMIAFILLLVANLDFILAINMDNYIHYVIRHILELAAYLIILCSLYRVIKHGEKKKQA